VLEEPVQIGPLLKELADSDGTMDRTVVLRVPGLPLAMERRIVPALGHLVHEVCE
jgi:hypothetical protein